MIIITSSRAKSFTATIGADKTPRVDKYLTSLQAQNHTVEANHADVGQIAQETNAHRCRCPAALKIRKAPALQAKSLKKLKATIINPPIYIIVITLVHPL